jgi:erythromycin esterase-like protein
LAFSDPNDVMTIVSRTVVIAAMTLASSCAHHPAVLPPASPSAQFIARARSAAVPLTFDDAAIAPVDDPRLAALFTGKQVVFLGEPDHYVHEKYAYRLLFIRSLFAHGFRWIGMEMGRSDAARIDHYLESGDEAWLDKVALYGYAGDLRPERTPDDSGDVLPEFRSEERQFLRALRALSQARPAGTDRLHFVGYDLDVVPGGGYQDIATLLAPYGSEPVVATVLAQVQRVTGETPNAELGRLSRVQQLLVQQHDDLLRVMPAGVVAELGNMLDCLGASLRFVEASASPDRSAQLAAYAYRERYMFKYVDEVLPREAYRGLILLGHDAHLIRDEAQLEMVPGYPQVTWPRLGTHLAAKLGARLLVVWMLYDHGEHFAQKCRAVSCPFDATTSELGHALASLGPRFALATNDPYLAQWQTLLFNAEPVRVRLALAADLLVYVRIVHALASDDRRP